MITVQAPVSGHPREAEKVSVTGAGRFGNDSRKRRIQTGFPYRELSVYLTV